MTMNLFSGFFHLQPPDQLQNQPAMEPTTHRPRPYVVVSVPVPKPVTPEVRPLLRAANTEPARPAPRRPITYGDEMQGVLKTLGR